MQPHAVWESNWGVRCLDTLGGLRVRVAWVPGSQRFFSPPGTPSPPWSLSTSWRCCGLRVAGAAELPASFLWGKCSHFILLIRSVCPGIGLFAGQRVSAFWKMT